MKIMLVTEGILVAILISVIIFLVVSFETSEEKEEIKELEDKVEFLEKELTQKNQEYTWLKELQDYCINNEGKLPPIKQTEPFKST